MPGEITTAAADIAVVVVSHRSASTLEGCLARLRAAAGVAQIRVVDNASDDGTLTIIQREASRDARLRFIANPDNPGFAVACNQGAQMSDAPWLAFVNPDLLVEADTLQRLRDAAATLGEALVGGVLLDAQGEEDAASRRRDPDFAAMLRSRRARRLAIAANGETLQCVDAVSGALMLLPRHLFKRVGGFDEGYRLHAEDLDLCRRVRNAGGVVAVANAARVFHARGVSSRSRPVFVEWHKHRGLWRYFQRFDAARHGWPMRAAVFAMIWARFPVSVFRAMLRAQR